jgi:hypothetical protein
MKKKKNEVLIHAMNRHEPWQQDFKKYLGGRGEKWTKPCMHIWIIKEKWKKKNKKYLPHVVELHLDIPRIGKSLENIDLWLPETSQ